MSRKPSVRRSERGWDPGNRRTYLDALDIEKGAPGTVCIVEGHYQDNRHPIPYRMGYVHGYRMDGEHWHRTWAELDRCEL